LTQDLKPLIDSIKTSAAVIAQTSEYVPTIAAIAKDLAEAFLSGHKLLACGNGGSAADAMHLTGEWVGRFVKDRRSYPALALVADGTLLTCLGNDYSYEFVFSRQVEGLGNAGDIFVVFSSSGNSENLIKAIDAAKSLGMVTVAILGRDGGRTKGLANHEVIVPATVTARIQEAHMLILHLICEEAERLLGHS
jgi:D-sedoheptulose 7-phosphate isomerase